MAVDLEIESNLADEDITTGAVYTSFQNTARSQTIWLASELRLSGMDGNAANITAGLRLFASNGTTVTGDFITTAPKFTAADTVYMKVAEKIRVRDDEIVKWYIESDNASDTTVDIDIVWLDPTVADAVQISGDDVAADNLESQYDETGLLGDAFPLRQDQGASISGGLAIRTAMASVTVIQGSEQDLANASASNDTRWTGDDDGSGAEFIFRCTPADTEARPLDVHFEGFYDEPGGPFNNGATLQAYNFQTSSWDTIETFLNASADETHDILLLEGHRAPGSGTVETAPHTIGDVLLKFLQDSQETGDAVLLIDQITVGFVGSALTAAAIVDEWETQSQADPTGFHINVQEWIGTAVTISGTSAKPEMDVFSISDNAAAADNMQILYDGVEGFAGAYAGPRGPGVFYNDAAGNANTVNGTDGTWNNPVSTISAVKTIADSLSVDRIYLVGNSDATLIATMEDYEFVGIGEMTANTITLGSQDVDRSVFYNLLLTGAQGGTGRCQAVSCCLSSITGMEITALGCLIANAGSLTLRNDCAFAFCFSAVAGGDTPTLNINSVANVNVYFRHYSGGLTVTNAVATTVMSYETDGQFIVDATCTSLTVVVRGNCSITDNGTTTNLTRDAASSRTGFLGGDYSLDTDANGRIRIVDGTGAGEINTDSGKIVEVSTLTGHTAQTGDSFARIGALGVGLTAVSLVSTGLNAVLVDGVAMPTAFQYIAAATAGKVSGAGTGTEVFVGIDGSTDRISATVDASGNRTAISLDP